jgi:cytochrome c
MPLKFSTLALVLATLILTPCAANAQDAAAGQRAFAVCNICHDVGETARTKVGPPLNGLFGRKAAASENFSYSDALKNSGIVWDEKTFSQFVANPRAAMPGTKMTFAGIKDENKIADLIVYLKQFDAAGKMTAVAPPPDEAPDPATLACVQNLGSPAAQEKCVQAGGELLQAIGAIVSGMPMSGFGAFDGASLVDQGVAGKPRYFMRLKLSATDPCVVEETELNQGQANKWAELVLSVYDFHKIARVRAIAWDAKNGRNIGVTESDPGLTSMMLEGPDWLCRETISLDPARAGAARACEKELLVNGYGPENRAVLIPALSVLRKACGLPK